MNEDEARFLESAAAARARVARSIAIDETVRLGELAVRLSMPQPTCSHAVRALEKVGFLFVRRDRQTTTIERGRGVDVAWCKRQLVALRVVGVENPARIARVFRRAKGWVILKNDVDRWIVELNLETANREAADGS